MKQNKQTILSVYAKYVSFQVLGMIGLSCYILADTFFIARGLGTKGLTALNLAIPVFSFISGFGLMIGMGGATRYSIVKAEKDEKAGNIIFSQSVMYALISAAAFVLVGIFFAEPISILLGADVSTKGNTSVYLRVILIFAPLFLINHVLLCFVRNDGAPKLAMTGMIVGSFSNIVLDYIFIFPLKLGMFGAALATGLAPAISLLILSTYFRKKKNRFWWIYIVPKIKSIADISLLGVSSLIAEVSAGIVIILFNMIILRLEGNIGVAAYGIVANLSLVATALFTGIAQGIQPIISHAYGKGELTERKKTYEYAIITGVIASVCIYFIVWGFAEPIAAIFSKEQNEKLIGIAVTGLRLYFTAFLFLSINVITVALFNSSDKPREAFTLSLLRGFVFIVPIVLIFAKVGGMTGVWLAFPITELLTMILSLGILMNKKLLK
ncbi:MAG: MATE family efflux transporter [Lachnospiraceae bacterium]